MAVVIAAGLSISPAAPAAATPRVTVAILPPATTVGQLARVPSLSVGVMSAGIGPVPALQTYLDVSQGNRVASPLYDLPLTSSWDGLVVRAQTAPADLVPGLLASTLVEHGVPVRAEPSLRAGAAIATDHDGLIRRGSEGPGVTVIPATAGSLPGLQGRLRGNDLLLAFAAPPPASDSTLAIAAAGAGFDGNLTSDSTRTDGYVLSTDIAPTILRRFGIAVPDSMTGEPIRTEGSRNPGAVTDRAARMTAIPSRRAPVLIACLGAWIALAALVLAASPRRRSVALSWLALCIAYLPLLLLAVAALEPGPVAEALFVGIGAGALAALTRAFAPGWPGLALACGVTVTAYAVDVIAGSPLTTLSLLGPNPVYGARFYGIGNELEALLAVMVPAGVGAGLLGRAVARGGEGVTARISVAAFLAAGLAGGLVFGAGRLGADVGAAIVLPLGAVVAAAALGSPDSTRLRPTVVLAAIVGIPLIAVALLAAIDLVSGGNAHLTRSVLAAGGAGQVADAAQRRLELNAHDFDRAAGDPLFWLVIAGLAFGISQRRRIDTWLRPVPVARAALLGACAALIAGTLLNDSGPAFLALGGVAIGAFLAFAWAQRLNERSPAAPGEMPNLRETRVIRKTPAGT